MIKRRVDVEERRLTDDPMRTSRKIRRVIWSTKNKWGRGRRERASSFKTKFTEKKSPPRRLTLPLSFFFLPPALSSRSLFLAVVLVSATLIGHWQTMSAESLTKRALYRMSERRAVFARGKTYTSPSLFFSDTARFRVYAWRINSFSPRYRWDLIGGYYLSWNWVKTRGGWSRGHTRTHAPRKMD